MRLRFPGVLALALAFGSGLVAQAPATARVTYSRSFKASDPAFFQIEVGQDGHASFAAREKPADPLATLDYTASPAALRQIFQDASALDGFAASLQSKANVAYTGDKMLAFDDATRHHAQEFTYTTVAAAAALVALFEKTAVAGMSAIRLRRAMQYQPLDVLDTMTQIADDWGEHRMAEPQLLLPALEQLASDPGQMEAARHRAQKLIQAMKAAK